MNNLLPVFNTRLLRAYVDLDERVVPLVQAVRAGSAPAAVTAPPAAKCGGLRSIRLLLGQGAQSYRPPKDFAPQRVEKLALPRAASASGLRRDTLMLPLLFAQADCDCYRQLPTARL